MTVFIFARTYCNLRRIAAADAVTSGRYPPQIAITHSLEHGGFINKWNLVFQDWATCFVMLVPLRISL